MPASPERGDPLGFGGKPTQVRLLDLVAERHKTAHEVGAADLLVARVEDHEVVDQFEETARRAEVGEFLEEGLAHGWRTPRRGGPGLLGGGLLPAQPVLLRSSDHTVAEPLRVVARHHELHGGEEGPDEVLLLVG